MKKLNESQIIQIFQKQLDNRKFIAEDVEVFGSENKVITSIDTLVESTDVPPGMKISDIARKSVVAGVSDFAAKGVKPKFGIISVVLPKKYSKKQIIELAKGFKKASNEFGITILGGDTNEGRELSISVALYGIAKKITTRKGAKKGDAIFVTGSFGNTAMGLQLLLKKKRNSKQSDNKMKKAFCLPEPRLNFGIEISKIISSAMDSSDGLAKTLNEMANQSKKKFIIDNLPYEKILEKITKNKTALENLVLFGGEEYELVFTTTSKNITKIKNIAKKNHVRIIEIGHVQFGKGVNLKLENKIKKIPNKGWNHFQ